MYFLCHVIGLDFGRDEPLGLAIEYTVYRAHPEYKRRFRGLRLCTTS